MQEGFQLFPAQASTFAVRVDQLYFFLSAVTVFFSSLIVILITFFAIRYRRRPGRVAVQSHGSVGLEIFWTGVPFLLVIVMFIWGSKVYLDQSIPPVGAE